MGVSGKWERKLAGGSVRACGGGGCIKAVGFTRGKWEDQGLGEGSDSWQVGLRRRFGSQVAGGSVRAVRVLVRVRGECGD